MVAAPAPAAAIICTPGPAGAFGETLFPMASFNLSYTVKYTAQLGNSANSVGDNPLYSPRAPSSCNILDKPPAHACESLKHTLHQIYIMIHTSNALVDSCSALNLQSSFQYIQRTYNSCSDGSYMDIGQFLLLGIPVDSTRKQRRYIAPAIPPATAVGISGSLRNPLCNDQQSRQETFKPNISYKHLALTSNMSLP